MKRRIFALTLTAISLLSSCSNVPELRSDIAEFITSFSYAEARKKYQEARYIRKDISHEASGEIITIEEEMYINVKDENNLGYDFKYKKFTATQVIEEKHNYVEKNGENYLYHYTGGDSPVTRTAEEIKYPLISGFFYKQEFESIHTLGMYVGDHLLEVLPYIQEYVTINNTDKTLTYDIPLDAPKDAKDYNFEELLVVDELGMTMSCDIYQTNGITSLKTSISVTNYI